MSQKIIVIIEIILLKYYIKIYFIELFIDLNLT